MQMNDSNEITAINENKLPIEAAVNILNCVNLF